LKLVSAKTEILDQQCSKLRAKSHYGWVYYVNEYKRGVGYAINVFIDVTDIVFIYGEHQNYRREHFGLWLIRQRLAID
jgi:hypothetical protein